MLAIVVTPWPIKGGPRLHLELSTPSLITRCSCTSRTPCRQAALFVTFELIHNQTTRTGAGFYAHSGLNLDKSLLVLTSISPALCSILIPQPNHKGILSIP